MSTKTKPAEWIKGAAKECFYTADCYGLPEKQLAAIIAKHAQQSAHQAAQTESEAIEALRGMFLNYVEMKNITLMVARSDAPNWIGASMTPEDDIHVIKARAILARHDQK